MMDRNSITYNATKTAAQFHADDSFFRLLIGGVGTGKTTANCLELFSRGLRQEHARDGLRHSRWSVIRNTYRQLKSTTIKTWLQWFPEKIYGKIKWDSPITHRLDFNDFDIEVLFMPIEGESDVSNLRSLELTGVFINEAQYMPKSVIDVCLERCDRYPSKADGAPITFTGVFADTNPPDTDHWIYKMESKLPENYNIFHYEPPLLIADTIKVGEKVVKSLSGTPYVANPAAAEYVNNLNSGYDYYFRKLPGLTDDQIKVNILGQYGFVPIGKPVYPEFNQSIHYYAGNVRYNRHERLCLAWDFGLTPALAIMQVQQNGQIVMIGEVTSHDIGLEKFATNQAIPHLNSRCPGWQNNYISLCDPTGGSQRSQINMQTCMQTLNKLGIRTQKAKTNNIDKRISAVSWFLRKIVDGKGAFIVTSDCPQAFKGFLGDYQFEKIMITDLEEGTKSLPLKNFSSHIHDCIQYGCMYYKELFEVPDCDDAGISGSLIV